MLAIAVIDHRRMIIPDELNALAFIAGLIAAGVGAEASPAIAILQALVRASLMFVLFFGFRAGYRALRGLEGMGFGDVKLAAVAGVWLDWASLPIVVEIAALSALAAALYARLRGDGFDPKARLPFGDFFRAGDLDLLAARRVERRLSFATRPGLGVSDGGERAWSRGSSR